MVPLAEGEKSKNLLSYNRDRLVASSPEGSQDNFYYYLDIGGDLISYSCH